MGTVGQNRRFVEIKNFSQIHPEGQISALQFAETEGCSEIDSGAVLREGDIFGENAFSDAQIRDARVVIFGP